MHAAFRGHERCLELLIRHGAHVDSEEIPHPLVFLRVLSMTQETSISYILYIIIYNMYMVHIYIILYIIYYI
jgi:hypothetical protein